MARRASDTTAGSAHAFATVTGAKGIAFQQRPQSGGLSQTTAGELATAPRWVRLVRVGTKVTGYSSADGGTWTRIGSGCWTGFGSQCERGTV